MPYYLDINPSNSNGNQYVTIPAWDVTGDFTIEIDCEIYNTTDSTSDGFVFSGGTTGGGFELYRDGPSQNWRASLWRNNTKTDVSTSNIWPYASGSTVNPRKITIQRVGGTVSTNFAGTAGFNVSIASGNNILISAIGARPNGSFTLGLRLYRMRLFQGATLVRDYDPSNTSSGVTLTDTVGGQNGTFQNPPGGNAQWVFYSSGATYDLQALGGTFSYSGASAALNRGFRLDATGGTFSYSGAVADLTYNTATVYRIDALGGSFTYTGAQATLLRNFRVDATGGAYSYVGGVASLSRGYMMQSQGGTFSYAGADASLTYVSGPMVYTITALGGTFSYTGAAAEFTATGVIPIANPAAFVNRAYVGGRLTNSAKIGGRLTNNATVAI